MISLLNQIQHSICLSPPVDENTCQQNMVRSYNPNETLNRTNQSNTNDVSLSIKKYGIRETGRFVNNSPAFDSGNATCQIQASQISDMPAHHQMSRTAPVDPVYQINLRDQRSTPNHSQTRDQITDVYVPVRSQNNWSTGSPPNYNSSMRIHKRDRTVQQFDNELARTQDHRPMSLEGRVPIQSYNSLSPKRTPNRVLDNASNLTIKRENSHYQDMATRRNRHGVDVMDLIIETLSQDRQKRDPSNQTEYQFPTQQIEYQYPSQNMSYLPQ